MQRVMNQRFVLLRKALHGITSFGIQAIQLLAKHPISRPNPLLVSLKFFHEVSE